MFNFNIPRTQGTIHAAVTQDRNDFLNAQVKGIFKGCKFGVAAVLVVPAGSCVLTGVVGSAPPPSPCPVCLLLFNKTTLGMPQLLTQQMVLFVLALCTVPSSMEGVRTAR